MKGEKKHRLPKPSQEKWNKMTKKEKQTFYNRRRTKEMMKKYSEKSHRLDPTKRIRNHKKYYNENKEWCLKKNKEWRRKNPEYMKIYNKNYRKSNTEETKKRDRKYNLRRIGVTLDEYNRLFEHQNGKCAICGINEKNLLKSKLGVDHCHKTGKIRQLLCGNCNTALGLFKDNIIILKSAVLYLRYTC